METDRILVFSLGIIAVVSVVLAIMTYSSGFSNSGSIIVSITGRVAEQGSFFGFSGVATFKNTGTSSGTACTTLNIYNGAAIEDTRKICKTVATGDTATEPISIPLDPNGVYGWEYK